MSTRPLLLVVFVLVVLAVGESSFKLGNLGGLPGPGPVPVRFPVKRIF